MTVSGRRRAKASSWLVSFSPRSTVASAISTLAWSVRSALAAAQHFETALQHGQQIVEIMRHPAGQLTERLHLLCLVEFGLGPRPPIHLAVQAPRGGAPAPGGDPLLLQLAHGEQRHTEQPERGRDRKQQIIDEIGPPRSQNIPRLGMPKAT